MRNNQTPKYYLYWQAFENATWILTDKKSGDISEYNYSEMSRIVEDAYISWHNNRFAKSHYNEEELKPENVIVRYIHQVGGLIAEINKSIVVGVRYSEILPDYTIDCYNWRYQCPHCKVPQDEVRGKE
ncbi:MAG: hypothetical protein OXI43_09820, partial [Candidatus Poribacteria bacterium]|nr:hypothetical protein [Candidatus Poribacteria bacterium]